MDEKAIEILNVILTDGPLSGPKILELMDHTINIKTLRKIIDRWNSFFASIGDGSMQIVLRRNVGYALNHDYFRQAEIRFLEDAIQSSSLLNMQEKNHLKMLCHPFFNTDKASAQSVNEDGLLRRLSMIDHAIHEQRCLRFSYIDYELALREQKNRVVKKYRQRGNDKSDPKQETYLISPYEIMMHKGQYYILSYCDKHPSDLTIFRIDRMAHLRLAKSQYYTLLKETVDYDKKKKQMVNMFVGNQEYEEVLIKFDRRIFQSVIDEFGTQVDFSDNYDGSPVLRLKNFAVSEGLIGWLLMMGEKVEVLAPQSLRTELRSRLKQMISLYDTSLSM